jgi:hypothetical protein
LFFPLFFPFFSLSVPLFVLSAVFLPLSFPFFALRLDLLFGLLFFPLFILPAALGIPDPFLRGFPGQIRLKIRFPQSIVEELPFN